MKINIIYIALLAFVVQSCSKMNDLSDKFLDGGEIIYAAKVDSAACGAGNERIKFEFYIKTNRTESIRIYWDDYTDSADLTISKQIGVFTKTLESMAERSYVFNIVCFDEFGNKSLPYELSGIANGPTYQNMITNRVAASISANVAGDKIFIWNNVDTDRGARYTELKYTNTSNMETVLIVPASEDTTTVTDHKPGTTFSSRTIYVPDQMNVDTFYTSVRVNENTSFVLNKKVFVGYSDRVNSGNDNRAENAVDGNRNNRWHSADVAYPHWVTFHMDGVATIRKFSVWPSVYDVGSKTHDDRFPTQVQLLVSMDYPADPTDDSQWIDLGTFASNPNFAGEQVFEITTPVAAKYVKFKGVSGNVRYLVIGEVDVYI